MGKWWEEERGLGAVAGVEGSVEAMSVVVIVEARGSNKEQSQGVRCTHDTHFYMLTCTRAYTRTHTHTNTHKHTQLCESLTDQIKRLKALLGANAKQLEAKDKQLQVKDKQLQSNAKQLEAKDEELRTKESQAQQTEQAVKRKLAVSEQRNETKDKQLVEKHQQLVEKHHQLQEKDRLIDRLLGGKEDADRLLRGKEGELALLREQLLDDDVVVRSRSGQRLGQLMERVMQEQMQRRLEAELELRLEEGTDQRALSCTFILSNDLMFLLLLFYFTGIFCDLNFELGR